MPDITMNIRNMGDLRNLEELIASAPPELSWKIKNILMMGAVRIAQNAKRTTTFKDRTGTLRRSIHAEPTVDGAKIVAGVYYASFQEYGTEHIPAKYFITNAVAAEEPFILEEIENIIVEYWEELS